MKTCLIEKCNRKHYARGWCKNHYRHFTNESKKHYQSIKSHFQRLAKYKRRIKKFQQRYFKTQEYKNKRNNYLREQWKTNPEFRKRIKAWKARQPIEKKRSWYKRDRDTQQFGGLREIVIQRDKEKCIFCGLTREEHYKKYKKDLTVDHINRLGRGVKRKDKDNRLENLQTLCISCHFKKDMASIKKNGEILRQLRNSQKTGGFISGGKVNGLESQTRFRPMAGDRDMF